MTGKQATITILKETKDMLFDVKTGRDTWDSLMVKLVKAHYEKQLREGAKVSE